MKTRLIFLLLIAALIGTNALWLIREAEAERLKDTERAEWQRAAKPVFDARGIKYKNPTPDNLRTALDATFPLLPHEGYKDEKWRKDHESRIYIEPIRTKESGIEVRKAVFLPTNLNP